MRVSWRTTSGLTAMISLAFVLATLLIGLLTYAVTHEAMEKQLDHRIATETRALLMRQGDGGIDRLATLIQQRDAAHSTASLGYILVDARGQRLAGRLDAQVPATPGYREFLHFDHGTRVAQALTTPLPDGGRLVVAADRIVIHEIDETIMTVFSAAFAAMLLLAIGGAWTVGTITRGRLQRIDGVARAIIAGHLRQRMPTDGSGSEFDQLSATLNRMLDRNDALLDNLRQVSSDVAHDLRTPLTRLHNRLQQALSHDETERGVAIEAAITESSELLELFAALLRISEIEAGALRDGFRDVAMSELVEDLIDSYRPDFDISGHGLSADVAPGVMLHGDLRLLRQLVANLLDNMLRHTPAGTKGLLTLATRDGQVLLTMADDGPGVAAEDVGRLFERFSRTERSRSTSGHGLGLALVAAIARMHDGDARLSDGPGFHVEVQLGSG